MDGDTDMPSVVSVKLLSLLRIDLKPMRSSDFSLLSLRKLCCIEIFIKIGQKT